MNKEITKKYIVGVTGASGSILAKRLIEYLSTLDVELNLVVSELGEQVFAYETEVAFSEFVESIKTNNATVILHNNNDLFSSIASGSNSFDAMFIVPCSMSTAGKIANCCGTGLLSRAADVALKERTELVIVPRETPLTTAHLKNMLTLTEMGARIVPPSPMFYDKNNTYDGIINGIVGRILKTGGIDNTLYTKWCK